MSSLLVNVLSDGVRVNGLESTRTRSAGPRDGERNTDALSTESYNVGTRFGATLTAETHHEFQGYGQPSASTLHGPCCVSSPVGESIQVLPRPVESRAQVTSSEVSLQRVAVFGSTSPTTVKPNAQKIRLWGNQRVHHRSVPALIEENLGKFTASRGGY